MMDFSRIISSSGFGMWHIILKDGVAPRMQIDSKMAQLLGIAGKELTEEEIYDSWYCRISPEAVPSVQASVQEIIEGNFSENTYLWEHPQKGRRYVRCGGTAEKFPDGTIILSGYHADVTDIVVREQRQKEELQASRDSLARIIEEQKMSLSVVSSLSDAYICIYYIDLATGQFREINPSTIGEVSEIIGSEGDAAAKFVEMSKYLVAPEFEWETLSFTDLTTVAERLKNRKTLGFQFRGIPQVGWCTGEFIVAGRDETGNCTHVLWVVRSIQDQKTVEEKHRIELEQQLDLVNTLSRDYLNVYMIDPDRNIVRVLKLNGYVTAGITTEKNEYPYEAVCYKYIHDRVYADDIEMMTHVMDTRTILSELENSDQFVGTYRVQDNGIHYYQYKYVKSYGSNSIIAAFQNVDAMIAVERARQEELQNALLEAEQASIAKTLFLNNMSHDIRTPMNAILGFANLMKSKKDDPDTITRYLDKIENSGKYLLSILNNVLDMARIESGKMELDLSNDDAEVACATMLDMFADEAERKHQQLTSEIEIKHRYVLSDGPRIRQIIANLLSNAVKYTPDGGHIHMKVQEMDCGRDGYVNYVVTISDNGIGMSREFQEHIFDSFSREHTTTESRVIGTGLGMSIVKKLVDMMDGTIKLESEAGKGSCFTVTLPIKTIDHFDNGQQGIADSESKTDFVGKHVLLAEDNDLNAEIAMEILSGMGIVADRAEDGVVCVEMITKSDPGEYDMILMDIQMPNLDGYNATRKIRAIADSAKASIPIIAMTANAFEEDRKKALAAGMNGHLAKPIEIPKLVEMLAKILNQ